MAENIYSPLLLLNVKDGVPGRGILSTVIEYAKNMSGTTPPDSGWSSSISNIGELGEGEFLWVRTTINYTSGSPTVAYSVSKNGIDGKADNVILDIRYSNDLESKTFTEQQYIRCIMTKKS